MQNLWEDIYTNLIAEQRYMYLVDGLKVTIILTLGAAVIGIVLGTLVALVKVSAQNSRAWPIRVLDKLASLYLTIIRGTPLVVQLFIFYFVILAGVRIPAEVIGIIAFGINSGAYVAEVVRAGILAVDKGQMEAGRSLGLTSKQTYISIIMPQAFKNILPALVNEQIALLKETSIVGYVAGIDITKAASIIQSQTYQAYVPYITIALIYLIIVIVLTKLLGMLERRLRKSDIR